jgi:hypothetical protein
MSKSRLETTALIAEVIAAIAVVVSVLYLALQISANNKLLKSQTYHNFLTIGHPLSQMVVNDPEVAALVFKCDAEPYSVSQTDWRRCETYYQMSVDVWEYLYYQNQDGIITPAFWDGTEQHFAKITVARPGYQRFWAEWSEVYKDPFGAHAGNIIPDIQPPE